MKTACGVIGAILLTIALGGCSVGPDYRAEPPPTPAAWSATSADVVNPAAWWTAFADPTLDHLVTAARTRNLDLRIAEARLREVRAQYGVTRSRLGPDVNAVGGVRRQELAESVQPGGGSIGTTWQAGFDATWEIDVFGGTRRAVEAAGAEVDQAEYQVGDVQVSITAETVATYLDLRAADERLAALTQVIAAQDRVRDLTARRLAGGLVDATALAQADADLAGARSRAPQLQVARAQALHRLGVLVGDLPSPPSPDAPHVLSTPSLHAAAPLPDPTLSLAPGLPSDLLLRRPDLRAAERALAAASANVGVAKADYFPRFSLTGSFGWTAGESAGLFSAANRGWAIGPAVRWPLFSAGRISGQVAAANARLDQAGLRYEQVVLRAAAEVEDALVRTALARDRVAAANAALTARQRATDLVRRRFERGLVDVAAVLEQERLYADARAQLVDARAEQGLALTALAKALGGGWEMADRE